MDKVRRFKDSDNDEVEIDVGHGLIFILTTNGEPVLIDKEQAQEMIVMLQYGIDNYHD